MGFRPSAGVANRAGEVICALGWQADTNWPDNSAVPTDIGVNFPRSAFDAVLHEFQTIAPEMSISVAGGGGVGAIQLWDRDIPAVVAKAGGGGGPSIHGRGTAGERDCIVHRFPFIPAAGNRLYGISVVTVGCAMFWYGNGGGEILFRIVRIVP